MLKRRGTRTDHCGRPSLRCCYLFSLPLAVARVKLRLRTSSMINQTLCLSGNMHSNLQKQAALTAVTDVIKECLVHNRLLFLHSR